MMNQTFPLWIVALGILLAFIAIMLVIVRRNGDVIMSNEKPAAPPQPSPAPGPAEKPATPPQPPPTRY